MKKVILSILFIGMIETLILAEGTPRINFIQDSYNFGRVLQGKTVEYTFTFENRGTDDLLIKEVTTSCGCSAALVSANVIKPGETGQIKVSYDSQGRAGKVSRTISVVSNDPVESIKELTITAMVDPSMHTLFNVNESIFSKKCGGCHFYPAIGKQGKELYDAVCAFCHGRTASGFDRLKMVPKDNMDHIIRNGIIGTEMPAWIKEFNGPLDADQVNSLISFIKGETD